MSKKREAIAKQRSETMSNEDRKTNYNRPLSAEETKGVMKTGVVLMLSAVSFMVVLGFLVHHDVVKFYPKGMETEGADNLLKGFAMRVQYTLRYQVLLVFWLMFCILATIYGRITTKAINPLDEKSETKVQVLKNITTNSFESIIISIFSQLIFISYADPIHILKFIPFINVLMFIGRISFFAGYPLKRAFGYTLTMWPNLLLNIYNLYQFGSFLGVY